MPDAPKNPECPKLLPALVVLAVLIVIALAVWPGRPPLLTVHGSPAAPLAAGDALDFGDLTLAVVKDGKETPASTKSVAGRLVARFDLKLSLAGTTGSVRLNDLRAEVLDGDLVLPAGLETPGMAVAATGTALQKWVAQIPEKWASYVVAVDYLAASGRRFKAYVRVPVER